MYSSPGGSNSAEPVQAPSSNEASTSSAEDRVIADQPSLLDHALSEVLRTNPDVDVAAGDWDAINAFTSQLRGASRSTRMYYALTTVSQSTHFTCGLPEIDFALEDVRRGTGLDGRDAARDSTRRGIERYETSYSVARRFTMSRRCNRDTHWS